MTNPRRRAHTPTREEIESYCRERKNGIDPDYFYDYYAATGWQVGQHPIRAWENRDGQARPLRRCDQCFA